MRKTLAAALVLIFFLPTGTFSYEKTPKITDREIVERLTALEQGQKRLEQKIEQEVEKLRVEFDQKMARLEAEIRATNRRIDDTNLRIDDTNRRIEDLRAEMNSKFEILTWMLGIFITLAMAILGFVVKNLWELRKKIDPIVKEQERQRKEIEFLMDMLRKLLPER